MRRRGFRRHAGCGGLAGEIAVREFIEQRLTDRTRRAFAAEAVEGHEDADVVVRVQMQVAVHVLRVTAVADDAVAVVVLLVEPQHHAVQRRNHVGRRFVHHLGRLGLEDAIALVLAVLQMRDHEPRHVLAAGSQAAGRRRDHDLVGLGGFGGELVALGHVRGERLGQGLAKRRMRHAEGLEDVGVEVVIERLPRDVLDQVAGEGGRVVGVGGGGARLEDARRR